MTEELSNCIQTSDSVLFTVVLVGMNPSSGRVHNASQGGSSAAHTLWVVGKRGTAVHHHTPGLSRSWWGPRSLPSWSSLSDGHTSPGSAEPSTAGQRKCNRRGLIPSILKVAVNKAVPPSLSDYLGKLRTSKEISYRILER